jgi:hypothetical protein
MSKVLTMRLLIIGTVAIGCLMQGHLMVRAQLVGDPQPLLDAAKLYRDNLDRLKTWSGEIAYSFRRKGKDQANYTVVECKISFALARDRQPPLSIYDIDITTDATEQGRELVPRQGLQHRCGLVRDGSFYGLQYLKDKPTSVRNIGMSPSHRGNGEWSYGSSE